VRNLDLMKKGLRPEKECLCSALSILCEELRPYEEGIATASIVVMARSSLVVRNLDLMKKGLRHRKVPGIPFDGLCIM
jgi:hypothetical protein